MRRYSGFLVASILLVSSTPGCDDEASSATTADAAPRVDAASDASTGRTDGDTPADGAADQAVVDASDGGAPDAAAEAEAGATVTSRMGSTGDIYLTDWQFNAGFHEDDTILHASDAPGCVAWVRSLSKPRSPAGDLTIGSDSVGQDGGVPTAIKLSPDPTNGYFDQLNDPSQSLFVNGSGIRVQVSSDGSSGVPALPTTTLRAPTVASVKVTSPTAPDSGTLKIPSVSTFTTRWETTDAGAANQRVIVRLTLLQSPHKVADLLCSWPLADGKGDIPPSLLKELRTRMGATAAVGGQLAILSGDSREITVGDASYVVTVTTDTPTDFTSSSCSVE